MVQDDLYLLRLAVAGITNCLPNIDADGAPSMAFHLYPFMLEYDPYSGDHGLGFFGHAMNVGAYAVAHPRLGWLCFLCALAPAAPAASDVYTITPHDSLKVRAYVAPLGLWLELQTGSLTSLTVDRAAKRLVASVAVALAAKGAIPAWLAACFLGRDAALIAGVSYQRARSLGWRWETWGEFFGLDAEVGDEPGGYDRLGTKERARDGRTVSAIRSLPAMEPQAMGKWSTAVQFALFGCAAASQTAWGAAAVPPEAMAALHYVAGGTTAASAATYYFLSSDRFRARRERMEARVARGKERMAAVKELGRSLKERGRANVSEKMERVGEKMGRIREKMRNADHAGPGRTQVE